MNKETTTATMQAKPGQYRPSLTFYHPNGKGTGGALEMELHPAHGSTGGCIMLTASEATGLC